MVDDVPYMPSVKNLHGILDAIQNAGVPTTFTLDFLSDLGFSSSNDRPAIRVLKFLGLLSSAGTPETAYREFVDHTKAKGVLARQLKHGYDDLFLADKTAPSKTATELKGWFKSKTGASDAVAKKMATTFRALADYADFDSAHAVAATAKGKVELIPPEPPGEAPPPPPPPASTPLSLGMVYRLEVHLPDTQNVDTYRAIFRALREELM